MRPWEWRGSESDCAQQPGIANWRGLKATIVLATSYMTALKIWQPDRPAIIRGPWNTALEMIRRRSCSATKRGRPVRDRGGRRWLSKGGAAGPEGLAFGDRRVVAGSPPRWSTRKKISTRARPIPPKSRGSAASKAPAQRLGRFPPLIHAHRKQAPPFSTIRPNCFGAPGPCGWHGSKLTWKSARVTVLGEWPFPQDWAFYPHTNDDIPRDRCAARRLRHHQTAQMPLVTPGTHKPRRSEHSRRLDGWLAGPGSIPAPFCQNEIDPGGGSLAWAGAGPHVVFTNRFRPCIGSALNTSDPTAKCALEKWRASDAWPRWASRISTNFQQGRPGCRAIRCWRAAEPEVPGGLPLAPAKRAAG